MTTSMYEIRDATASGIEPIRIPPQVVCAVEGCSHVAERGGRYCQLCREEALRIEMRIAPEPTPIARF